MGSCISKCRPQTTHNSEEQEVIEEKFNHVQDKLVVITQSPSIQLQNSPLYNIPHKISPSPSPTASTSTSSSVSSFTTCPFSTKTTSSCTSSISSSSSTSSSSSKDVRSFSNDFLWSCYKENPHIIRINSIKERNSSTTTTSFSSFPRKLEKVRPLSNNNNKNVTSQKRVRSSSPSGDHHHLTRQKSFRRDTQPEKLNSRPSRRTSRSPSPSPSRRFVTNGDNYNKCTSHSKRTAPNYSLGSSRRINSFGNYYSDPTTTSYYSRKDNTNRPSLMNPKSISSGDRMIRPSLRRRDNNQPFNSNNNILHRIGSKIDEVAVGEAMVTDQEMDSVLMEDIDHPLISLDCFIFL